MTNATGPAARRALVLGPLLLIAWLFLAAIPALADGGPHVAAVNNGTTTLTTDSCAGCHRTHTAQGAYLLKVPEEELCKSCHGDEGTGATTDVWSGVQYALGTGGLRDESVEIGALRGGGFDQARLASTTPARVRFGSGMDDFHAKVSVGAAADVTSAHIALTENDLSLPGVAWGNGAAGSGVGPAATVTCGSCHNVHGNGQYRILRRVPAPEAEDGTFAPIVSPGAPVLDAPVDPDGNAANGIENPTKNYTVIQRRGTTPTNPLTFLLYSRDVVSAGYGPTTGDYFHRTVPWNQAPSGSNGLDAPNGRPSSFNTQMTNWCLACHTRYFSTDPNTPRVDPITGDEDMVFRFQHQTTTNGQTVCTTCHVAHGSNAKMDDLYSGTFPYPDDPSTGPAAETSNSSRLLKVDNRGTCQLCHDPTNSTRAGDYTGPIPTPGVP